MYGIVRDASLGRDFRAVAGEVQDRPMARSYVVTDPEIMAGQLRDAGLVVDLVPVTKRPRRAIGGLSGAVYQGPTAEAWRHVIVAREPSGGEYARAVSMLLAHDGGTSFRAMPSAWRQVCANEFRAAPVKIFHTNPALREIVEDPVPFVRRCLLQADGARDRLERLRIGERVSQQVYNLLADTGRRRLAKAFAEPFNVYSTHDWHGTLQAMTQSKRPFLQRLADRAMTVDFDEIQESWEVPTGWWDLCVDGSPEARRAVLQ